jgi:hypothetical protein
MNIYKVNTKNKIMYNNQRGLKITQSNCKVGSIEINVDSEKYNDDYNYSKSINNTLLNVFKSIGDSY